MDTIGVRFPCDWGHVKTNTTHTGKVVGGKDGKLVVWINTWTKQRNYYFSDMCTVYDLDDVYIFNPKYKTVKRKQNFCDVVREVMDFRHNLRIRKATITSHFGTRWYNNKKMYRY